MEGAVDGIATIPFGVRIRKTFRNDLARRAGLRVGLVLSLAFLGLLLRLIRLEFQPLWWDEGYSAWFATHSLGQMAALTAEDIHPPLYYALLHLWTLIAGPGPVSLRLLSVLAGVGAIPLMYAAALRIFGARRIALLAAFLLAINPLHIYYSQEVRMYGLVALLSTGVLWAAWGVLHPNREHTGFPAETRCVGGAYVVLTTLALYAQYYAVFLPFAITLYALWRWRKDLRGVLRWFALQAIVAVLYLPWVMYAGPRLTLYVSQKVVQDADRPLGFSAYFARHLAAFTAGHLEGGLAPWWPVALVVLAPVVVGLVISVRGSGLRNSRAGERDETQRVRIVQPIAFLATVLLVALFLGWLIGLRYPFFPDQGERLLLLALPAFVMLAAAGLAALTAVGGLPAPVLFVVISGLSLALFYTVPRYPGDDYRPLIARTVEQGLPGDTVFCIYPWQVGYWRSYAAAVDGPTALLTPSVEWNSTLQAALDAALGRGHVWFPAHLALGGILETRTEQFLASRAIPFANTWYGPGTRLSGWQGDLPVKARPPDPAGSRPIATYALPDGGQLTLIAAPLLTQVVPASNQAAAVLLAWQGQGDVPLAVSVRLVDDYGQIWAQNDYEPLGAMVGSSGVTKEGRSWQGTDRFGLLVPAGTPPGRYRTELVVLPAKEVRPLVAQLQDETTASSVYLFAIEVVPAAQPLTPDRLPITSREPVDLGDGLRFLGYTLDKSPLMPGNLRRVSLFWQAVGQPASDWTAFVQLLGKDGRPVAPWEAPPGAAFPTSQWQAGTLMRTQAYFRPSAELADGRYALIAGLYRPSDGVRMQTSRRRDSLSLGSIEIRSRPYVTTLPKSQHTTEVTFGSVARLLGYDVSPSGRQLTLHWQALSASERSFTVFVHVLDTQGQVVGRGDSEPGEGAYPTTGWRKGEYLADTHTISLPEGSAMSGLSAAVGLYDPATGERLLTPAGDDKALLSLDPRRK